MGAFADAWNGIKETVGGAARTNLGKAVGDALSGDTEAAEKEYEKGIIRACAAAQKTKRKELVDKYDKAISRIASETKSSLKTIGGKLDSDIKGQFSKAINQAIKDKASAYDDLAADKK
ncbi:hypothetical protein [Streptococcus macacae]|uniref:Uncharacterized protein n=1 Tax=Streptococcus macacae NCTC 11558 TaxID=764298 RepID=G5JVQ7_9STRE|nr:hypothetical protein [Streptococcus macacae]EHJ52783.1 hypothetical protein STRMA_0913 [Streptococcus macacae NCTC 11558]SUN78723.1 Uncharacterised protein [Streptococcus macacae NCTC 11558]